MSSDNSKHLLELLTVISLNNQTKKELIQSIQLLVENVQGEKKYDVIFNYLIGIIMVFNLFDYIANSDSHEAVMKCFLESVTELLEVEHTNIYLANEKECVFYFYQDKNEGKPKTILFNDAFPTNVYHDQSALMENKLSSEDRKLHSRLAIPLFYNSNIVGVIECQNKKNNHFEQFDQDILIFLSNKFMSHLFDLDEYAHVKSFIQNEDKLRESIKRITAELHFLPLIKTIRKEVEYLIDVDRSTLFLIDKKTDELWVLEGSGDVNERIRFSSRKGIAGSVFHSQKTVSLTDVYSDSRFNPEIDQIVGYHTESILCLPLIHSSGQCIGVIQALNKVNGVFTHYDEKRLEILAEYASIAIENSKQFEAIIL